MAKVSDRAGAVLVSLVLAVREKVRDVESFDGWLRVQFAADVDWTGVAAGDFLHDLGDRLDWDDDHSFGEWMSAARERLVAMGHV